MAIPQKVREAIELIVAYNWQDEERDFEENVDDLDDPEYHIFTSLKRVSKWLDETKDEEV